MCSVAAARDGRPYRLSVDGWKSLCVWAILFSHGFSTTSIPSPGQVHWPSALTAASLSRRGDGALRAWSLVQGRLLSVFTADTSIIAVRVSPYRSEVVVGDRSGCIYFLY